MIDPCFECGNPSEHDHHVVPQIRGGTKTVPLCSECHGKAHHWDKAMSTNLLTKEGLARARARGVKLGGERPE
jgi:5-methylcytosine-specific restriction endonuclease McrA